MPLDWLTKNRKNPAFLKPHNIPPRYLTVLDGSRELAISDLGNAMVRRACLDYLKNISEAAGKGIAPTFFGRGGSYKTLGAAVLARLIQDMGQVQVDFLSCATELARLERLRFDESTATKLAHLNSVPFLVVDDFDAARPESWQSERLIELAESRYSHKLPTLWTCNITVTKTDQSPLINRYGQPFARRIWEGSEGFRVVIR